MSTMGSIRRVIPHITRAVIQEATQTARRGALGAGVALITVATAVVPAAAQGASTRQVCTGYAGNQKCNSIDVAGIQNELSTYLHGIGQQNGTPGGSNVQAIGQQVQTIMQQLNSGNLPGQNGTTPGGGNGNLPPVDPQAIQAKLQELQQLAQQYLATQGGPGNPTPSPTPTPTPIPTPGSNPTPNPTPGTHPTPNPNPGNSPGPNPNPGSGTSDLTQVCQKLQDGIDKKISSLNASAQDALARLDAALTKLQAYQSTAGSQNVPPDSAQLMAAAQQAQTEATQAVATLAALSVNVDCSQSASAIAGALSTVKAAADTTKAQLQDFQKSLTDVINSLAAQAKP